MPRQFQHRQRAVDIGARISARIDQRIADAGLGGQMDDVGDVAVTGQQGIDRILLGQIGAAVGQLIGERPGLRTA